MTNQRKKPIIFLLLMVIGAGLLLYSPIAQWISRRQAAQLVAQHQQRMVEQADRQEENSMDPLQAAEAFNEMLAQRHALEMLQPAEMQQYMQLLNPFGDGVMGTLRIPGLDIALPIGHTAADHVLQTSIGHMPETSLPIGGESTHAVLAGHSGLANARLLTDLPRMAAGDTFTVEVMGNTLTYQVDQILTVLPDALEHLAIIPGEDHVTLLTCVPYGINSHRLLVRGIRVNNGE